MITAKFGGSSLVPRHAHRVKNFVTSFHGVVVVSAVGKEFDGDVKATDLLFRVHNGDALSKTAFENKYKRLAMALGSRIDVEQLLFDAFDRAKRHNCLPYTLSLGEELSAKLFSEYLSADYVEADQTVRFKCGNLLDLTATKNNLKSAFRGVKLGVIGGFYGGYESTRQTFSRGGSDVTGALCSAYLGSTLYENYTDVSGLCVADPHKVFLPATVPHLSYRQMLVLAKNGANVLHPSSIRPLSQFGVPLLLTSFFDDSHVGTLVSYCESDDNVVCLTEKRILSGYKTAIVHNLPQSRLLDAFSTLGNVKGVVFDGDVCTLVTKNSVLCPLHKSLVD